MYSSISSHRGLAQIMLGQESNRPRYAWTYNRRPEGRRLIAHDLVVSQHKTSSATPLRAERVASGLGTFPQRIPTFACRSKVSFSARSEGCSGLSFKSAS